MEDIFEELIVIAGTGIIFSLIYFAFAAGKRALTGTSLSLKEQDDIKFYHMAQPDPNATNELGQPLLYAAILGYQYERAFKLIEMGADINKTTSDGNTPLFIAANRGKVELCNKLLSLGADVNAKNHAGVTPLIFACEMGYYESIKLLLDNGASINEKSVDGKTALRVAIESKEKQIAAFLKELGAIQ